VAETAMEIGKKHDIDQEKIYLAGLMHDCAKFKNTEDLLKYADKFDIILDEMHIYNVQLIHAHLGAKMAKEVYGIGDREILSAIKYHTTGKEDMTILEKLIFISDYIEPSRNFKGVEEVRELVHIDLDSSIILSIKNNIRFLLDTDKLIDIDTIKALNYLRLENIKNRR
jgi:predicted HD superfamily hydrolase involved in NAD metabolism